MTKKEFIGEFSRLMSIYGRVNPNDDQMQEWFKVLKHTALSDFCKAVDECGNTEPEFPASPVVILAKIRNLASVKKVRPSCEHCEHGRIFYTRKTGVTSVREHELSYDSYAACDCAGGDLIAEEMMRGWRQKGVRSPNPISARYSWLWQRFGGIETAKAGRGMDVDPPPAVPVTIPAALPEPPTINDDDKGESFEEWSQSAVEGEEELPF